MPVTLSSVNLANLELPDDRFLMNFIGSSNLQLNVISYGKYELQNIVVSLSSRTHICRNSP